MKKQGKTKPSSVKKQEPDRSSSTPFVHFPTPSHRIPGQPLGLIVQDRSKFDPGFHPLDFLKSCQEGKLQVEIAAAWVVNVSTITAWSEKYPVMKEAVQKGKTAQQAYFAKRFREGMMGEKKVNTILTIFGAKNILGWSDDAKTDFEDDNELDVDFDYDERKT